MQEPAAVGRRTGRRPGRPPGAQLLHLAALWSLAVAQPVLDVLGNNAEFFAIRRSEPVDIILFAVGLVALPPLALFAVEAVAQAADARAGRAVHLVLVAALAGLTVLLVLKRTGASGAVIVALCALAGAALTAVYARSEIARSFVTVLAAAPVVVVLVFLFTTPVRRLVTGGEAEARIAAYGGRAPVVMVVFDELPLTSLQRADGRIDTRRFPNFAALASDAHWFRNASAVDGQTQVAVPAILTARRASADKLPTAEDHPDNLFTLLGAGRRMHVHEAITQLCPARLCSERRHGFGRRMRALVSDLSVVSLHVLLPRDLRDGLPSIDSSWQDFLGDDDDPDAEQASTGAAAFLQLFEEKGADRGRAGVVRRFVAGIPTYDGRRPGALSFLHILLPHVPWMYGPDGRRYGNVAPVLGLSGERWGRDQGAATVGLQRHLLQLEFVDRLVGELLRKLRVNGTYDESLVVVTADHGSAFRAGQPRRRVTLGNVMDLAPVPLLIKAPGQRRGRVHDNHVSTVDILPTMASLLRLRVPWRTDGRSALDPRVDRRVVRMSNAGEGTVAIAARRLDTLRATARRRQAAMLGDAPFPAFKPAGTRGLVGRRVRDALRGIGSASATVDDPVAFTAVRSDSTYVPGHVSGRVRGMRSGTIAVAVDGRIRAVTPLVRDRQGGAFSAMLPPRSLQDGPNRIDVLGVVPAGESVRLLPLARAGASGGRYALRDGQIVGPAGARYRIVAKHIEGGVDTSVAADGNMTLTGWAAGTTPAGRVDQIVGFAKGRLVFFGAPQEPRPDVARQLGIPATQLGFRFEVREDLIREAPAVFALRDGVASRLTWFCGPNHAIGC